MRTFLMSFLLVLTFSVTSFSYVYAEEPVPTSVTENDENLQSPWNSLGYQVLYGVLSLAAGALAIIGTAMVKKGFSKLGFELSETTEKLVEEYLTKGIEKAEAWAKEQSEKPSSEDKRAKAVKVALDLAKENETVKNLVDKYAVSSLNDLVEKLVRSDKTSDEVTPKK